jgi:hypothetical protein
MRLLSSVFALTVTMLLASPCWSGPHCRRCSACGTSVTIDFESYPGPDGKLGTDDDVVPPTGAAGGSGGPVASLSDQWASVGVVFSRGSLFYASHGFTGSGFGNYYLSSQPVEGSFLIPVYGIAITSYSKWNAKLTAYDGNGRVLGVSNLWHPAPGSSGPWHRGTLRLCTSEPIAKFSVVEQSGNASLILNLDGLVLTTSAP